ncbi:hypothetical protein D9757_014642 [Collybiopsis confluens]|uniref:Uncharacterized protein n=1 Tax=Collybiopsis confluens TaxID=2823264 RepID=A0A8H5CN81_9AGAR|nr:hypothetical protein D9757_014642 [Collybiopsis confluens]
MSSAYDPSLLASAPRATSAMKQEGYDPQLLQQPIATRSADNLSGKEYPPYPSNANAAPAVVPTVPSSRFPNSNPHRKPVPFWQTRNGIILIAVLALVVIAAIIGGAVGGSKAHRDGNHAISSPISNSSSNGNGAHGSPTTTIVSVFTSVKTFGDQTVTQVVSSTITEFAPGTTTTGAGDASQGFAGAGAGESAATTTTTSVSDSLDGIVGSQPTKAFKRRGWKKGRSGEA